MKLSKIMPVVTGLGLALLMLSGLGVFGLLLGLLIWLVRIPLHISLHIIHNLMRISGIILLSGCPIGALLLIGSVDLDARFREKIPGYTRKSDDIEDDFEEDEEDFHYENFEEYFSDEDHWD